MRIDMANFFKQWTAWAAIAGALFAGHAPVAGAVVLNPIDLGTLSSPQSNPLSWSVSGLQGSFEQTFTFALSANLGLGGDFFWRNRTNSSISGFDATLSYDNGDFIVSDTSTSSVASSFNPYPSSLDAGNYKLVVSGIGAGTSGGFFSVALSASAPVLQQAQALAVPEPGAWLMFGAGLLLMGTCVRHRFMGAPLANATGR